MLYKIKKGDFEFSSKLLLLLDLRILYLKLLIGTISWTKAEFFSLSIIKTGSVNYSTVNLLLLYEFPDVFF